MLWLLGSFYACLPVGGNLSHIQVYNLLFNSLDHTIIRAAQLQYADTLGKNTLFPNIYTLTLKIHADTGFSPWLNVRQLCRKSNLTVFL